jgi:hypothetical protein
VSPRAGVATVSKYTSDEASCRGRMVAASGCSLCSRAAIARVPAKVLPSRGPSRSSGASPHYPCSWRPELHAPHPRPHPPCLPPKKTLSCPSALSLVYTVMQSRTGPPRCYISGP